MQSGEAASTSGAAAAAAGNDADAAADHVAGGGVSAWSAAHANIEDPYASLNDEQCGGQHSSIRNESVPIQLAQCRFPGLAISNAKIFFR